MNKTHRLEAHSNPWAFALGAIVNIFKVGNFHSLQEFFTVVLVFALRFFDDPPQAVLTSIYIADTIIAAHHQNIEVLALNNISVVFATDFIRYDDSLLFRPIIFNLIQQIFYVGGFFKYLWRFA